MILLFNLPSQPREKRGEERRGDVRVVVDLGIFPLFSILSVG